MIESDTPLTDIFGLPEQHISGGCVRHSTSIITSPTSFMAVVWFCREVDAED